MITVPQGVRILVARRPVDFRRGADSLAAAVQEQLQGDPFCGDIFIFRSKRADRVKIVFWDGTGLCLFQKRLEHGRFVWPGITDGTIHLTSAQLSMLLEGLDWTRIRPRSVARPLAAC